VSAGTVRISDAFGRLVPDQIVQVVRERQINRTLIEQDAGLFTTYVASVITLIAIITWVGMVLGFPNDALNH
jgi:hypothetical protein